MLLVYYKFTTTKIRCDTGWVFLEILLCFGGNFQVNEHTGITERCPIWSDMGIGMADLLLSLSELICVSIQKKSSFHPTQANKLKPSH